MSSVPVVPRVAESALFGHSIASTDVETEGSVADAVARASHASIELLVVRVPVSATAAVQGLERTGAVLCDTLLTLQRRLDDSAMRPSSAPDEVRLARPSDAASLHALSMEAFTDFRGHWHTDDRLTASTATRLYAQWAADLARTATEAQPVLLVLDAAGAIAGFLALAQRHPAVWSVPLAAVRPAHRGRRRLGALVRHAMHVTAHAGGGTFQYETQLDNLAAIRAVSREGFVPDSSRHTFHLWLSVR